MNAILAIPFEFRLAGLFLIGICAGAVVNLAVYRLAWDPRSISPWSRPSAGAPPRRADDRIPLFGWIGLRREADLHGSGFWVRPMFVELFSGVGLALLYWWEVGQFGLRPDVAPMTVLHAQFACHVVLMGLMLVGSLIDVDEKIIPDSITVPGTIIGLAAAAAIPMSLLPDVVQLQGGPICQGPLHVTSPNHWPAGLDGFPLVGSLALGLGCWWLWCVGLMERRWHARVGWRRAFQFFLAGLMRRRSTGRIFLMGLIGTAGVGAVWLLGGASWTGLLTALVGMAAGGGLIWSVRIVGTAVLGREAMGFGDVTLMAMIGAFLGWQSCLMIFFLAPFAGLLIGVFGLILHRQTEIPYGPFLCLAAAVVIVRWTDLWAATQGVFAMGFVVPTVIPICLVLMGLMLGVWRLVLAAGRMLLAAIR